MGGVFTGRCVLLWIGVFDHLFIYISVLQSFNVREWMSSNTGELETHSVKPYTKSDLASISLPNVIRDYTLTAAQKIPVNPLLYLYPDIPKDVAFGRYYISSSDGRYSLFNHSFIQKRRQDKSVKLKQQRSIACCIRLRCRSQGCNITK